MKSKYGLTELSAGPAFNNGERFYGIVKEESLKEDFTELAIQRLKDAKEIGLDDFFDLYAGNFEFTKEDYIKFQSKIQQWLEEHPEFGVIKQCGMSKIVGENDYVAKSSDDCGYYLTDWGFDDGEDEYSEILIMPKKVEESKKSKIHVNKNAGNPEENMAAFNHMMGESVEEEDIETFDTYEEAYEYLKDVAQDLGLQNYEIVEDNYEVENGLILIERGEEDEFGDSEDLGIKCLVQYNESLKEDTVKQNGK